MSLQAPESNNGEHQANLHPGQGQLPEGLNRNSEHASTTGQSNKEDDTPPEIPEGIDPTFFQLSEEEKENAADIKDAIESLTDADNLSDFMYANMALVWDVATAVEHAYLIQEVRNEYKILLTYEDGVRAITELVELWPTYFLSYMFDLKEAKSVLVMDLSVPDKESWRDPRKVAKLIRGGFYVTAATFPTLEVMRKGKTDIFEFEGFQWGKGMVEVRGADEVTRQTIGALPSKFEAHFYHTPMMANVFVSMLKKMLPTEVAARFHVGFRFAGGRLSTFYLQPTPEIASKRTLGNLLEGLKIRFDSEKMFSLDTNYGTLQEEEEGED
ncbi:expressed unknown protein [Seminavis robusta]|uniref:Uncharacterized protein n=1 Tax=Seminavis robusta TaxID=568900 RepID=A0A9N8ES11_9STRA|nr:expressed unknown protein [Seminavis robusta]|eukprot:Sro1536_g280630.1 n/a (327) ;mRNA; f:19116-20196